MQNIIRKLDLTELEENEPASGEFHHMRAQELVSWLRDSYSGKHLSIQHLLYIFVL